MRRSVVLMGVLAARAGKGSGMVTLAVSHANASFANASFAHASFAHAPSQLGDMQ